MSAQAQPTEFACEVREVFSGDDLLVLVDLGVDNLWKKQRVRLSGVDTPNAIAAGQSTAAGMIRGEIRMLTRGKKSRLTIVSRNNNSWVCILVVETPEGPVNINEKLIAAGFEYKAKRQVTP